MSHHHYPHHHGHHGHGHHHHHHHEENQPPPPEYGNFQSPPQPVVGFPQPVPPPGALHPSEYYARGYQSVPVNAMVDKGFKLDRVGNIRRALDNIIGHEEDGRGRYTLHSIIILRNSLLHNVITKGAFIGYVEDRGAVIEPRLPCCGIGLGWFLFITGFFLAAIPWYVAAFILLCTRSVDHREKPAYVICTIAAVLAAIAIVFGLTRI